MITGNLYVPSAEDGLRHSEERKEKQSLAVYGLMSIRIYPHIGFLTAYGIIEDNPYAPENPTWVFG
jgi:hypothetical protein